MSDSEDQWMTVAAQLGAEAFSVVAYLRYWHLLRIDGTGLGGIEEIRPMFSVRERVRITLPTGVYLLARWRRPTVDEVPRVRRRVRTHVRDLIRVDVDGQLEAPSGPVVCSTITQVLGDTEIRSPDGACMRELSASRWKTNMAYTFSNEAGKPVIALKVNRVKQRATVVSAWDIVVAPEAKIGNDLALSAAVAAALCISTGEGAGA
jgi:hypothetical protein